MSDLRVRKGVMGRQKEMGIVLNIYSKLKLPKDNVAVSERGARFIHDFLNKTGIRKTLEIGLGYGASAAYIISATNSKHVVIDPFIHEFAQIGIENLQKLKMLKNVQLIKQPSHAALPDLLKKKLTVDFAFIDGHHTFDSVFLDFYYIDLLLNKGGYVLFDDGWMRSVQTVASFIRANKKNYHELKTPIKNFVLFKKTGDDARQWDHFKPFANGTLRSMVLHSWHNVKKPAR